MAGLYSSPWGLTPQSFTPAPFGVIIADMSRASFIFPGQAVTERRRQKAFGTGRACTAIASEKLAAARVAVRSR